MSMLNNRNPQKLYAKGERAVEHGSYHCQRSPLDLKRTKIDAPSLRHIDDKIPKSLKVDDNADIQAKISLRIARDVSKTEDWVSRISRGKAYGIQQTLTEKNEKVVTKEAKFGKVPLASTLHAYDGMEANSGKVPRKSAVHASDGVKSSYHRLPPGSGHSLSKIGKGFSASKDFRRASVGQDHASSSISHEDYSRKQVHEALKQFEELFTKIVEEHKRARKGQDQKNCRADIKAAMMLKKEQKWINGDNTYGHVPGVKIGDEFQYRAELAVVGLHLSLFCGIHSVRILDKIYATSIVNSGRYKNVTISSDVFIYTGEGGNPKVSKKTPKDQKLERGNLALKNSKDAKLPVRVLHGRKTLRASSTMGINNEKGFTYVYDGLYLVTEYCQERDESGKLVLKFKMERMSDDPNLIHQTSRKPRKKNSTKGALYGE